MSKENICPKCGDPGHGPYTKMTRNRADGNTYRKYTYFMHKVENPDGSVKTKWCYIKKSLAKELNQKLPNQVQETSHATISRRLRDESG